MFPPWYGVPAIDCRDETAKRTQTVIRLSIQQAERVKLAPHPHPDPATRHSLQSDWWERWARARQGNEAILCLQGQTNQDQPPVLAVRAVQQYKTGDRALGWRWL